ncbi:MAG: hypothetical protein K0Q72_2803, partial [Armatimonadetes bacterium]|nr:hypothetical protein [Armatimonadota bacterium]
MPTGAMRTWSNKKLEPALFPECARMLAVKLAASLSLARGTVLGEKIGTNELQKITISGGADRCDTDGSISTWPGGPPGLQTWRRCCPPPLKP